MRVSVAYRIAYGFATKSITEIHAPARPATRRPTNHKPTAAPIMHTPDSERTAQSPEPNTAVHTCSNA